MARGPFSSSWGLMCLVLLCLGGAAAFTAMRYLGGGAEVAGKTTEDRITSICRIAQEERPGAGPALVKAAMSESDPAVRRAAVLCLGQYAGQVSFAEIEPCTRDAEPRVRSAAAIALAHCEKEAAAHRLWDISRQDANEGVRLTALEALLAQGSPLSIVALLETMEKSSDNALQLRAANLIVKKYKIDLRPEPDRQEWWNHLVEVVKVQGGVQRAYKKTGRQLVRHPEHQFAMPPTGPGFHSTAQDANHSHSAESQPPDEAGK